MVPIGLRDVAVMQADVFRDCLMRMRPPQLAAFFVSTMSDVGHFSDVPAQDQRSPLIGQRGHRAQAQ
jgi:hypothetical protein